MELTDNQALASKGGTRAKLQSVEDFMKEQEESDAFQTVNLHTTKKRNKGALQAERDRPAAEQSAKKADLEADEKSIEQRPIDAVDELGAVNWVGKLLEYRNAHPTAAGGLTYVEGVAGSIPVRFTCTVLLHESPQHFGHSINFSNKKDAKRYASKKAIDWLIANSFMPADGSVKFRKALPPPTAKVLGPLQLATPSPGGPPKNGSPTSYACQIPDLCSRLGFNAPSYEITKDSEITSFWSGYAHFVGDPRIEGKVGEAKSVFGKSNAKEQIAMEVLSFLRDIERQRREKENKEAEEDDRKRKRESINYAIEETSGKLVKVKA